VTTSDRSPPAIFPSVRGGPLLVLLGPVLAAGLSFAQPVLRLSGTEVSTSLSDHIALLRDPGRGLGIDDARKATAWTPLPRALSLGYTKDAVWLRFDIERGPEAPPEWLLALGDATLDDVRLWQADTRGRLVEQRSGSDVPRGLRPVDDPSPVFRLFLQPGRQTIFVRIWTRSSLAARLDV